MCILTVASHPHSLQSLGHMFTVPPILRFTVRICREQPLNETFFSDVLLTILCIQLQASAPFCNPPSRRKYSSGAQIGSLPSYHGVTTNGYHLVRCRHGGGGGSCRRCGSYYIRAYHPPSRGREVPTSNTFSQRERLPYLALEHNASFILMYSVLPFSHKETLDDSV